MSPAAIASEHTASSLEVIWDRGDEWDRRLRMIQDAQQWLYLSLFYLEYDRYGQEMVAALRAAQQRGVRVQLIIDTFGQRLGGVLMDVPTRQALRRDLDALASEGGHVVWYAPRRWLQRLLGGGHHYKVQVSEAGEMLVSSGNVTKSSFEGWNECALAVRGPIVASLLALTRQIGAQVDERHLYTLTESANPGAIPVECWFCNPNDEHGALAFYGRGWRNGATDKLEAMINAATSSVVITSFYFKPAASLMRAVINAARRGVRVEVFHSHRDALPATDLAWIAAATSYPALLDAGVIVHENRRGEHSKIVFVDGNVVACGSYNFEDAAHDKLAEVMLVTRHGATCDAVRTIIGVMRSDPDVVEVTSATMAAWPTRVRRRVWWLGRFKRYM